MIVFTSGDAKDMKLMIDAQKYSVKITLIDNDEVAEKVCLTDSAYLIR